MAIAEYLNKTPAQLKEILLQLRKEQLNLRFQKAAGSLANPNRWREVRKQIARLKTAMNAPASKKEGK